MADAVVSTVVLLDRQVVVVEGRIYHGDGTSTIAQLVAGGVYNPRNNEMGPVGFADITGGPYDNDALESALNSKANNGSFDPLGAATTSMGNHLSALNPHNQYQVTTDKGVANGYAGLDGSGKVPTDQLPAIGGGAVDSVNGEVGVVVLDQDDIADGTTYKQYSNADKTKLAGIASGATANSSDAVLKARANHTGTQPYTTITGLGSAANADTGDFDPVGAAATAVSAHVALSDPHTQYQKESEKGAVNGYAALDGSGQIPVAQIPAIAITDYLGASANQAAMLALDGQKGDWTTRTDLGNTWVITGTDPTVLANWTAIQYPASPVSSVAGRVGAVVLTTADLADFAAAVAANSAVVANTAKATNATHTGDVTGSTALTIGANKVTNAKAAKMATNTIKGNNTGVTADPLDLTAAQVKTLLALSSADVGLANVDNTSDVNKPVSTAQAAAIAAKADISTLTSHTGNTSNPHSVTKSQVGLSNVDNTSDVNKPVSTAQAAATTAAINAEVVNRNNAIAAATAGLVDDRGPYDASTDLFPATGGSGTAGAVLKGDQWQISVTGTLGSGDVNPGDIIRALTDGPGQTEAFWYVDAAIQKVSGGAEDDPTTTDDTSYMTPVRTFLSTVAARTTAAWKTAVKGTVLSGFTAVTAAPVDNTKTIEEAITLLQAQMDLLNTFAGAKWYRAVISQTGTSAPTAGGLAGTIGIAYARATTGSFTLTAAAGTFVANKTRVYVTNGTAGTATQVQGSRASSSVVGITSKDSSGTLIDGGLTDCSVWIIVEP